MADPMLIAQGEHSLSLLPGMADRHGSVAGATGTGKTVTLQVIAEHFNRQGVPVFAADVLGSSLGGSRR
ncbi:MAG TPA: helicase HerA-like domain-containing protein [Acidobacteriaceae bacterium]